MNLNKFWRRLNEFKTSQERIRMNFHEVQTGLNNLNKIQEFEQIVLTEHGWVMNEFEWFQ